MSNVLTVLKNGMSITHRMLVSYKNIVFLLICTFHIKFQTDGLIKIAVQYKKKLEGVFLPYIHSSGLYQMIFGILCIYIFSEAPFQSKESFYKILRIGKRKWGLVSITHIFFTSCLIMFYELAASILINIRQVHFCNVWDAVWNTISISYYQNGVFFSRNTIISYTPASATIRVFCMGIIVVGMVGLIQYTISLIFNTSLATAFNGVFCVLPLLAGFTRYPYLYYISPLSWIGIIEHSAGYRFHSPSITFMFFTAIIIDISLIVLIEIFISRKDMEICKE